MLLTRISKILPLCLFLSAAFPLGFSAEAAEGGNGSDRGGGDGAAADFNILGRRVGKMLERWRHNGTLPVELATLDIARFQEVVAGTLVVPRSPLLLSLDLCRYHPDVTGEQPGCSPDHPGQTPQLLQQIPVTATQGVGSPFIELDPFRWLMLREFSDLQAIIVFHEYYGISGREDRNYELSRAVAELVRQERDDEWFRTELTSRLRSFADVYRNALMPNLDANTTAFAVIEQTEEYRRCVLSPAHGERATECRDLGAWMTNSVIPQVQSAMRIQDDTTRRRLREAELTYLSWALSLPTSRQNQAYASQSRITRAFSTETTRIREDFQAMLNQLDLNAQQECPQAVTGQSAQCAFRYARRLFTQDLVTLGQRHVTQFNVAYVQAEADIQAFSTR
mgnify:CR=1 FL=1